MKLIVGLGNPGKEYEKTRHNAGFMVIDEIAKHLNITVDTKKFKAVIGQTRIGSETVILMKPQTYMNLSGEAVREIVSYYHINVNDIVLIYDDLDLPVGSIRLRSKGSSGGQNGVKNIIQHLHTQEIPRIRVGIGKDSRISTVDYVLGKFRDEDQEFLHNAIENAKSAAIYSIEHSFSDTMSLYNKK